MNRNEYITTLEQNHNRLHARFLRLDAKYAASDDSGDYYRANDALREAREAYERLVEVRRNQRQ